MSSVTTRRKKLKAASLPEISFNLSQKNWIFNRTSDVVYRYIMCQILEAVTCAIQRCRQTVTICGNDEDTAQLDAINISDFINKVLKEN